MITKEQYIESLVREIEIIKHLAGKVDPTKLDYRPTEKQRSTLELMQYMGQMVTTGITAYIAGNQNMHMELSKNKDSITFENFISKMDEQAKFVKETVGALTEADMTKESTIFGSTRPLAMHLLQALKSTTAYKMQLFLYIKASGNDSISTSNLWGGMDMPAKA
ncbi:MAG TPA: hypothetical protein VGO21_04005 [Candidatus Paceibacterota bacterium]|jgi:hypothetical protein|nr:hypothetical protein [Candidatus Paceibacterota bacterium]